MKVSKSSTKVSKQFRKIYFPSDSDFPLIVNRQYPQNPIDKHTHDFDELVIITEGNGIHITEKSKRSIYAGDVFLLRKGEIHSYTETNGLKLINILFKSEKVILLRDEFRRLSGFNALFRIEPTMRKSESQLRLSPEKLLESLRLIELIENEIKKQSDGWSICAKIYFLQLIILLSRAYSSQCTKNEQPIMNLAKVISFIEENPHSGISIGKLCEIANMSRSSFFREFSKSTGYSPHEYIIRIRVFKAMNEIIQSRGKISIKEASTRAGFNDSNYFSRIYKKVVNEPPSKTKMRSKFLLK